MDPAGAHRSRFVKYGLDLVAAWCALPAILPVIGLIAAAIRIEDLVDGSGSAPILYRETRISGDRRFELLKFRVLKAEVARRLHEGGLAEVKAWEHDPEAVSSIGRLLVRFYLDELPQILHVASGTMSMVGPRPVLPRDRRRLDAFAPYRVKAGLAGTFQLAKGTADILDLDMEYVQRSAGLGHVGQLRYDVGIILRTIRKMCRGEGL